MSTIGAIVLAAGEGTRLGEQKQFLELSPGVRLVDAAVVSAARHADHVVLVVPSGHRWEGREVHSVVFGGKSRLESVIEGLEATPTVDIVILHDAAHPLAPDLVFADLLSAIEAGADGAVPLLPVAEVVKRRHPDGTVSTLGRDGLGLAQMPMAFRTDALRAAHREGRVGDHVEDSSVLEALGMRVVAVPGAERNIHVITQGDLELARLMAVGCLGLAGGAT